MNPIRYREMALRTLSASYHADKVPARILFAVLDDMVRVGKNLDHLKKALFYGKDIGAKLQEIEIDHDAGENAFDRVGGVPAFDMHAVDPRILHAIIGMATETTELIQAAMKPMLGEGSLDKVNLKEESGDVDWYQEILGEYAGFTRAESWTTNIAKLAKRYGDKFSDFLADNRDLEAERRILETPAEDVAPAVDDPAARLLAAARPSGDGNVTVSLADLQQFIAAYPPSTESLSPTA
jgi:hypothetical protein